MILVVGSDYKLLITGIDVVKNEGMRSGSLGKELHSQS